MLLCENTFQIIIIHFNINKMKNHVINLFIVDDDVLSTTMLKHHLNEKFGTAINISTFTSGKSVLEKIDKYTSIVILDYYLEGENGNDVLKSIKEINPKTEVIMLSSNEDITIAIESFRKGATNYVIKGEKAEKKITHIIYDIIAYPIRFIVREFGVSKFLAIFLLTFFIMGIAVAYSLLVTK
jgi:response regulator RpfG family c-di-GMP phosphodiesterase